MEVRAGSAFSGTCRKPLVFFDCGWNTVPSESCAMKWRILPLLLALGGSVFAAGDVESRPYHIIPEPVEVSTSSGVCKSPKILKQTANKALGPEGYKITIKPQGVEIQAGDRAGLFYAKNTLEQLQAQYKDGGIPCGVIEDKPRFGWRSMMMDTARHFVPVEDVKKFIDVMSFYKFNKLHFHLTDDQGWRLPVPGYPKLESVASRRKETFGNKTPHGGMYTKEQLKDLVKYAAARNIEIIPEIDVPGHNQALCTAYPEFLCFPNPKLEVRTNAGISYTLVCPGNPDVWKFYNAVFNELKDIFPSQYVHLGGDEAPEDNWMKCPKCADFREKAGIREENKKAAAQKEMVEFFTRCAKMLKSRGKTAVFWYEPMGKYPDGVVVTTWRGGHTPKTVANTTGDKVDVICAPNGKCYFDYPQLPGDWPSGQPDTGWMPVNTLENVYSLEPGHGLSAKEMERVRGVDCCLWAERLPNIERVFYQAYPRALALVETAWSPKEVKNLNRFKDKLEFHKKFMQEKWGISLERPEKK